MDALDSKILDLLNRNARRSFATIGKEIGLSAPAVGKRVKQLEEEGIIAGYYLKLNERKLGVNIKAYITVKLDRFESFLHQREKIENLPEVQSCNRVTGEDCLILLAHFRNNEHLTDFLEIITKFGSTKTNIILD